jgi:hypothetical protein
MNPLTLLELLGDPGFQKGFVAGLVALVAILLVRKAGWLLAWGLAALAALAWTGLLRSSPNIPSWAVPVGAVTVLAAAVSFYAVMRKIPAWAAGLAFALWVLGVWGTAPDTERAAVVMGTTAALLPGLWPGLKIRVGWEGSLIAAAALVFVAVTDGAGRTTAIAGSLGMVGMPLAAAAASRWLRPNARLSPFGFVGAMAINVVVCGRVAGQAFNLSSAWIIAVLSALVTGAGFVLVSGDTGTTRPGGDAKPRRSRA